MNQIICTDALLGLRGLNDESIPLVVTSPPYDDVRIYGGHTWDFHNIAIELYRVVEPGGVVCWVVGEQIRDGSESGTSSEQRLFFRDLGFLLYNTLIVHRSGRRAHGTVRYGNSSPQFCFVLSKGKPKTINLIRDVENTTAGEKIRFFVRDEYGVMDTEIPQWRAHDRVSLFSTRDTVWTYGGNKRNDVDHPAMMDQRLAADLIISWSNPGDLVLDPFMGGGTTAKMARLEGHHYLGFEINSEYVAMAEQRLLIG